MYMYIVYIDDRPVVVMVSQPRHAQRRRTQLLYALIEKFMFYYRYIIIIVISEYSSMGERL